MTFDSFNITDAMKEKGISKMGIQGDTFLVVIYNDISIKVDYNKEDWFETTKRFESAAAAYIVDQLFIQKIVSELTLNWYSRQKLNEEPANAPSGSGLNEQPKSVIEMRRQLKGPVVGYGKLIGFSEQYVVISRTTADCQSSIRCACDAVPDEHTRICGYSVDIKHNPPTPIIVSVFDTGNEKNLVCPRCKGIDYEVTMERRIARLFILDDLDKPNANVRQQVIVYDDMVEDLTPGELVQVEGEMYVERKAGSGKNTKMDNVLHATSIKYLKKTEVVPIDNDIKNFYKWKQLCDKMAECPACLEWAEQKHIHPFKKTPMYTPITFIDRIVEMIAPNVVRHRLQKRGLLRSIVGAIPRGPGRLSGKIHTFMVGEKGTAKSKLGEETASIKPNSGHVSGTHASTKTITAIVDPDTKALMLGIIPLSDLVAIDEVDKIPPEEQARLLDILEEQRFTKDAYGFHFPVDAQTAIIGTGNPTNPKWNDANKIETHEINILDTLRDRFTQVFIFREDNDTEEKRSAFAVEMNAIRKRPIPNYTFLRKFLVFASTIKPDYTLESEKMLNKFWAQQDAGGLMNNRFYNSIFKIAEAEAKLQLSDKIDEEIATETMKSIQLMLFQYAENVKVVAKPSEITLKKFTDILENTKAGVVVSELCRIACKEDAQIFAYIGKNWTLEGNGRLQQVVKSLRKHPRVKPTSSSPLVFQWFPGQPQSQSDESDGSIVSLNEVGFRSKDNRNDNDKHKQENTASDSSDSSVRNAETQPIMATCPTCPYTTDVYTMKFHQCEATG